MLYRVFTKVFSLLILLSSICHADNSKNIIVYTGPGAGPRSVAGIIQMVKKYYPQHTITRVSPQNIADGFWLENTDLLIMPGGEDLGFVKSLAGKGNENIVKYVISGGKYLGICAGAYYAADNIVFKDEFEVSGNRNLKFYLGQVKGPVYKGFDPKSQRGAKAIQVKWTDRFGLPLNESYEVYYNGGGSFVSPEKYKNTKVLALYQTKESPAAIVECEVGKGIALLSGIHFEYFPKIKDTDNMTLQNMNLSLQLSAAKREELVRHLLARVLEFHDPQRL